MSAGFLWTQNPFQAVSIGLVDASVRRTQGGYWEHEDIANGFDGVTDTRGKA